jgi:DNA-binding beta-propeller fold protein YncE
MAQARWTRPAVALTAVAACVLGVPGVAEAGWFAYAANRGTNTISQYSIGSDGALSPLGATTAVTNSAPWDVVVSPDARSLYASYAGPLNAIAEFDIGADGTLTPKPGHETIAAGGGPNNLAISPDGKQLYVANFSGDSISEYDIGAAGVLSPKLVASLPSGMGPVAFVVTPDGQTAYSANYTDGSVGFFSPLPDGGFGPTTVLFADCGGASGHPNDLRVSPDGKNLYVADDTNNICQFNVPALSPPRPELGAGGPWGIEIAPDGKHLYAPADTVRQFSIFDDGSLGFMSPTGVAAGTTPRYAAISPDGKNLYSTNEGDATVSQFDIGSDAKLTAKTIATVAAGTTVSGIAVTPNQAPVAEFDAAPGAPGSPTAFDASASSDRDGSVARYDWDFGDGTTLPDGGATPSHTYQSAGTYPVTLSLTDNVGCAHIVYTGKTAVCNAQANVLTKNVTVSLPVKGSPNVPPAIRSASLSRRVFVVNSRGRAEKPVASRAKKGTTLRYTLSERARLVVTVRRVRPRRRIGAFAVASKAGRNRHAFSGRVGRKRLKPGRYLAVLVATDAGGLSSSARRLKFKVVRR